MRKGMLFFIFAFLSMLVLSSCGHNYSCPSNPKYFYLKDRITDVPITYKAKYCTICVEKDPDCSCP